MTDGENKYRDALNKLHQHNSTCTACAPHDSLSKGKCDEGFQLYNNYLKELRIEQILYKLDQR